MAWSIMRSPVIFAAALLVAMAAPAPAQGTSVLQQNQEEATTGGGQQDEQQATLGELKGKILREKEVGVQGSETKSKLVLLQLENGQQIAVDLGPTTALKAETLKEGAEVTVHGGMVKVGDNAVFLADQVDVGGQNFKVERPLTQDLTGGGQTRQFQMNGVVENTQTVDVRSGGQNMVALLHNEKDRRVLVDLGPVSGLADLQLKKGDRIAVTGHSVHIGDRSILFADSLSLNNRTVQVARPQYNEEQEQGQESQGQMGQQGQSTQGLQGQQGLQQQGQTTQEQQQQGVQGQTQTQEPQAQQQGLQGQQSQEPQAQQGLQGQMQQGQESQEPQGQMQDQEEEEE